MRAVSSTARWGGAKINRQIVIASRAIATAQALGASRLSAEDITTPIVAIAGLQSMILPIFGI
jgi:hypothetical protein